MRLQTSRKDLRHTIAILFLSAALTRRANNSCVTGIWDRPPQLEVLTDFVANKPAKFCTQKGSGKPKLIAAVHLTRKPSCSALGTLAESRLQTVVAVALFQGNRLGVAFYVCVPALNAAKLPTSSA